MRDHPSRSDQSLRLLGDVSCFSCNVGGNMANTDSISV